MEFSAFVLRASVYRQRVQCVFQRWWIDFSWLGRVDLGNSSVAMFGSRFNNSEFSLREKYFDDKFAAGSWGVVRTLVKRSNK